MLLALAAACADGSRDRLRATASPQSDEPVFGAGGAPGIEPGPPWFSLPPGSRYFERDGTRAPVLLRNVSAAQPAAFVSLFRDARAAGTTVVRLQLTQGFGYETLGIDSSGAVLSGWASSWDAVFDEAGRQGLGVIPVFAIWGDWNDGTPALGWVHFGANPLGSTRGGKASSPAELFADTETQRAWLGWLSALVARWSARPNIVAWEVFSELDLATGSTEASATDFVTRAHEVIEGADPWQRPAFASTSDLPLILGQPWQALWNSPSNDLAAIHPYDPALDRAAVDRARSALGMTDKPVLVGESGLDAAPPNGTTLTSALRAEVGLRHAIWAELVSGAASARALYWEDGYSVYYPGTGLPLVKARNELEREPARWLLGKDFGELSPIGVSGEPPVFGAAMGARGRVLGWARNDQLAPPAWDAAPLEGVQVRVSLPPDALNGSWAVTLTDPEDGTEGEVLGSASDGVLSFDVAGPFESVAFDANHVPGSEPAPVAPVCPGIEPGQCVEGAYELALNGASLFADPECPPAMLYVHLTECHGHVRLTLNSCPTDEGVMPRTCVSISVDDVTIQPVGTGTYYDAEGTPFPVAVDALDFELESTSRAMQGGVVRGSLTDGTGSVQPFVLEFKGCSDGVAICLI